MLQRPLLSLALLGFLAACGGSNPFTPIGGEDDPGDDGGTGGGGGTSPVVPEALSSNVNDVDYDGATLRIDMDGLDSTPDMVTFERYAKLDVPGYEAFIMQEDALDRMFVALAAESQDGATRAVAVADGGQFQRYFGGGYYERDGAFDRPDIGTGPGAGQVSYAGNYAGVTNVNAPGADLIAPDPGTDPSLLPDQPARVTGDIFLNVNFSDNQVNGSIYNRVIVDRSFTLDDVILLPTTIATDGTFAGTVEGPAPDEGDVTGNYGGIFGGTESSSVAGVVYLTAFEADFENEQEHGVFVLTQCGLPGDAAICDQVAPR